MNEAQKTAAAARKAEALLGFYIHLACFGAVMLLLLGLNFTDPEWWVQWPFLGWGLGVVAHWWAVLGGGSEMIARWHSRKVYELKREM